ncbi:UNVERIFIED_CONTAM: putative serine/threonine protein kinase IRE4 [Sesamum calycinum]|uniref:non-specific serine/threonine protein kinase n=1 Tax=Sesamum calycinum TaxID=2727403 RepID=A0AAW2P799_9LAMI
MAEQSQNGGASGFLSEIGIPSGLNRIKTRRVNVNSGAEDSDRFNESPSTGFSINAVPMKQKLKALNKGHPRFGRTREGFRKGRKIARWFASSFFKDSQQVLGDFPSTEINDLADIARCVAGTDILEEGCHEFLLACMHDLQEILQHTKYKALLVDTFGGRIESLLREKYILACNQVDRTDDVGHPESATSLLDSASQSSTTSTPSHPANKDRTSIDDFDIIKPISRGAYGKVFLARKRTTGDLFAIKVRFFYSFTSTDNLYLVMEYLNGGDLFSLLKKIGCLEEAVARTYIAELLTDFGLSKIGLMNCTTELPTQEMAKNGILDANGQLNTDKVDSHQSAVGTPDYLAPEILLGTEHGYAADWWSVGIILFEFITGVPPFNADHPEKNPWPLVPNEMSYEAQDLIDRFLVHDPNQRLGANGASEKMDECGDLAEFDSSPLDLSLMNFSFKNLSQLASINQDVLLQSGKESSRCSSPCKVSLEVVLNLVGPYAATFAGIPLWSTNRSGCPPVNG